MKVKWVNSSSVLSWMYWSMSPSRTLSASVYRRLPLPPGTSLSWMPPSSLYCCQASVSRISAAARNLRMAASPGVRPPLPASAKAGDACANSRAAPTVPAPTASPPTKKERRLVTCSDCSVVSMISSFWSSASKRERQMHLSAVTRSPGGARGRGRAGWAKNGSPADIATGLTPSATARIYLVTRPEPGGPADATAPARDPRGRPEAHCSWAGAPDEPRVGGEGPRLSALPDLCDRGRVWLGRRVREPAAEDVGVAEGGRAVGPRCRPR